MYSSNTIEPLFFIEKKRKKEFIILNTEQGKLNFLLEDLIEINKKEYINNLKKHKYNKFYYINENLNLVEDFPYNNIPFFYLELIKKEAKIQIIKKEIINQEEYLLCKNINNKNEYLNEFFLVKEKDLILKKKNNIKDNNINEKENEQIFSFNLKNFLKKFKSKI